MDKAPVENVTVTVAGEPLILNPNHMKFNENTLSDYMDHEYGWIDYLGKKLEFATKEMMLAEGNHEFLYNKRFVECKDEGGSDNYAKAKASSDTEVVNAYKHYVDRKYVVGVIKAHLRAWDKNHDNAQNRGHTLRKELDKLNKDIYQEKQDPTCTFEDFLKKD
jgi:hypothetical protein